MNWRKKRVLVTGAGGFIGSHLTERLVALGAKTSCFVRYNSRNDWGMLELLPEEVRDRLNIISGDLKDADAVLKAVKKCDIVFHLGALIAIPYSYVHPLDFVQTNIGGTVNLLNACMSAGVEKLVHTSTSEVYGTAQYAPIDEDHPLQGQSPYSASKIGADKMVESYFRSFGLPVATIRPFNTFGPRQSARAIIPTIITQILTGSAVRLGSLHPTRDFTFVSDIVAAFIRLAESPESIGQVVNIGSGTEISIGDLCRRIARLSGRKVEIVCERKRVRPELSEVERLLADSTKAQSMLGWRPLETLDSGLRKTIRWIRKNLEAYKSGLYNV